mmetsp:Transcript_25433/g.31809  ORF Transcript_25433/g.31809 Transcript_25433/m.31809 type:complete len:99 (+) Transcript_25433:18-314(+)
MLQTGLSHGVAIIPNAPKQRFNDPDTGAHFEFEDMCERLEKVLKKRFIEEMQSNKKGLNKNFMKETRNGDPLVRKEANSKTNEEVLQENGFPMKARRI